MRKLLFSILILLASFGISFGQNPIVTENLLAGTPQATWDANEGGPIEGFAQEFSVNKGQTVHFKVNIASAVLVPFTIKIYRIGWYGGNGARFITDLGASLTGKSQPGYLYQASTGKADCTNWSVSASWTVPNTLATVSGVYIARFDCPSVGGSSIQQFVVRDDAANSPVLFKTSDATWQAYNTYGGNTFYAAATPVTGFSHATKVSYQRPLYIRGDKSCFFNSEYPMIRWLERNGYNMSYATDQDMARDATIFTPSIHKVILSVGHDEYYSIEQRTKFENARANGVHVAFFSGNEMYWKTRWEDSYQTLVCYKEGTLGELVCGSKCDPLPTIWTGLWRDGCPPTYAANDGCKPEGSFSGQMSWAQSTASIKVPAAYKNLRFWKNTTVAALGVGQTKTLPYGTLGNEWDPEQFTNTYPAHRVVLSNTVDIGLTHKMALYRYSSGALIFSAGTMQWAWGLDNKHDLNTATPPAQAASADMQQATVNVLHEMGVDAASLQAGLIAPVAIPDVIAPTTTIVSPTHNSAVSGTSITVTGTSTDPTGILMGVEISIDNGVTWQAASGLGSWTYTFTPGAYGSINIKARAWDDFANLESNGVAGSSNNINIVFSPPLPVSLINFSGRNKGGTNLLEWTTASEQNSSHYDLLRSTDGINFVKAGTVAAAGNSNASRSYQYSDNIAAINSTLYYYKLKMVDINGAVKYSPVVKIRLNGKAFNMEASPNPFSDQLSMNIETTLQENAVISLKDISGKNIRQKESLLHKGSNAVLLTDLNKFSDGIYFLTITTDTQHQTVKVVKQ